MQIMWKVSKINYIIWFNEQHSIRMKILNKIFWEFSETKKKTSKDLTFIRLRQQFCQQLIQHLFHSKYGISWKLCIKTIFMEKSWVEIKLNGTFFVVKSFKSKRMKIDSCLLHSKIKCKNMWKKWCSDVSHETEAFPRRIYYVEECFKSGHVQFCSAVWIQN